MKKIYHLFAISSSAVLLTLSSCSAHQANQQNTTPNLTQNTAVPPQNDIEKAVLTKISNATSGKSTQVGNASFVVTNEYFAASGRQCKSIVITQDAESASFIRTACEFEGTWGYAPEVLPPSKLQ